MVMYLNACSCRLEGIPLFQRSKRQHQSCKHHDCTTQHSCNMSLQEVHAAEEEWEGGGRQAGAPHEVRVDNAALATVASSLSRSIASTSCAGAVDICNRLRVRSDIGIVM
jgi:hypothetical protein